jgi:5-methylcytosine-specific restriction endonuclease McrA
MSRRLDPQAYAALRSAVLQRDGWRCQWCGSLTGVEVHHLIHRSQGGADSPENLLSLCVHCHALAHNTQGAFARTTRP